MMISREDVIRAIDREMAKENTCLDNLEAAQKELNVLESKGPINGIWMITSHRPVIGPVIITVKRFLRKMLHGYIPPIVEESNRRRDIQNRAIRYLISGVEEIYRLVVNINEKQHKTQQHIEELEQQLAIAEEKNTRCTELITGQQEALDTLGESYRILQTKVNELDYRLVVNINEKQHKTQQHIEELEQQLAIAEEKNTRCTELITGQQEALDTLGESCRILQTKVNELEMRHDDTDKLSKQTAERFKTAELSGMFASSEDIDTLFPYVEFEDRYRGSEESISEWQEVYLKYFLGRENVLDVGCGRGEFLTLLKDKGVRAKGIDSSEFMVERCRRRDLDVEQADVFAYLEQLEEGALDGVFCSQVVEHFSTQQLLRFISLLSKKVRIGAPVVIETINPGNIVSSSNGFYMDISHIRPVHSATLSFLMEANGFPYQEIHYLHPETDKEIPYLEIPEAVEFNERMKNVNQLLFGARDYGLVAYRQ